MIKLKDTAITQLDIAEYLQEASDFAFEMIVLKKLKGLGFKCEHSGTYHDPLSKKTKEFDIRAHKEWGRYSISLSVECKSPRENYPMVVHAVPRSRSEAFHQVLVGTNIRVPADATHLLERSNPGSNSKSLIMKSTATPYTAGAQVGKSLDQIGRDVNGRIRTGEGEVFDRVSHTINGAYDLIQRAHFDKNPDKIHAIIPMLVIPDGRVWQVDYDQDGNVMGGAFATGHCPYFVGRRFRTGDAEQNSVSFTISHLEIVTLGVLEAVLSRYTDPDEYPPGILPFGEKLT